MGAEGPSGAIAIPQTAIDSLLACDSETFQLPVNNPGDTSRYHRGGGTKFFNAEKGQNLVAFTDE